MSRVYRVKEIPAETTNVPFTTFLLLFYSSFTPLRSLSKPFAYSSPRNIGSQAGNRMGFCWSMSIYFCST